MDRFRVLIVDDEEDFVETLVNRLNRRNLETTGVGRGEEAVARAREQPFDAVVLDLKMPGMDGIETLKEIKKIQPLAEVILLTGHGSMETSIEGMQLGAFDYVLKPIKLEDLLVKLAEAFKKKALHEQKIRDARIKGLTHFPEGSGRPEGGEE